MTVTFGAIQLANPWILLVPPVLLLLFARKSPLRRALPFPDISAFKQLSPTLKVRLRNPVLKFLTLALICCSTIAASRPQKVSLLESPAERRNIMLTVDVSRSMSATDFSSNYRRITRLDAVKAVLAGFVDARPDDRLGAIVFGAKAFVQAPLTLDHSVLKELLARLDVGIAGDGTAIGDGLALSLKRMKEIPGTSKAVILLTDGASNAGQIEPLTAAKIAQELGIKVHTIGIGSDQDVMPLAGGIFFGNQGAVADFDEKTLKEMARITGGLYFHAKDLEGLKKVYSEIDALERSSADEPPQRLMEELFHPWLLWALYSLVAIVLLESTYFFKVP